MSTPKASLVILGRESLEGSIYVGPETFDGAQTYSVHKRRLNIYTDGTGSHFIPPEWTAEGVTVRGFRTGGRFQGRYVRYEFSIGSQQ